MSRDGIPNTCEVDLPALITTFILNRLAGAPAFNFDITAYLAGQGAIQFAHCGAPAGAGSPQTGAAWVALPPRHGRARRVSFPGGPGTPRAAPVPVRMCTRS